MTETATTALEAEIADCINNKTKPLGALGRVETVAAQIAVLQQRTDPVMERARLLLFAADHGIAQTGVSAYPQEVTAQMVTNFLNGGAAANVFARAGGIDMAVINAGVAGDLPDHPDLIDRSIARGTANFLEAPAMTPRERDQAWAHGMALGAEPGWDAALIGEMGIGNTSAAALVAHKLINAPLDALIGSGTGLTEKALAEKRLILERAARRVAEPMEPREVLRQYGGFEIVMMAGAMTGAAESGKLVLVDGVISTAAALAVLKMQPDLKRAMVFGHRSGEHGHDAMLAAIGASALLDLDMRLGEGSGALLAWPLVRASARMMREMASFAAASVSGPVHGHD